MPTFASQQLTRLYTFLLSELPNLRWAPNEDHPSISFPFPSQKNPVNRDSTFLTDRSIILHTHMCIVLCVCFPSPSSVTTMGWGDHHTFLKRRVLQLFFSAPQTSELLFTFYIFIFPVHFLPYRKEKRRQSFDRCRLYSPMWREMTKRREGEAPISLSLPPGTGWDLPTMPVLLIQSVTVDQTRTRLPPRIAALLSRAAGARKWILCPAHTATTTCPIKPF